MKTGKNQAGTWNVRGEEGKGTVGCVIILVLLGVGILVGIEVVPIYYAHKSLETDVKTEISRAGAHFYDDENLLKNILFLAKRNEIRLTRENVKLERFAGQVHITILYTVPMDLYIYHYDAEFRIKASSFVGRL